MTLKILKVRDINQKHETKKNVLSSLPARIIVCGKSALSGKTNFCVNLLCQDNPEFYKDDFLGENIWIVSASLGGLDDKLTKLVNFKEIPDINLMNNFDEKQLEEVYDECDERFRTAIEEKKKVPNFLIYLDDISFSGALKSRQNGVLSKLFSNGRHSNISIILTCQKYSDCLTSARENMTMGVFFACSNKQLDLISDDINYELDNKEFKKKFRSVDATGSKHGFMGVNFFKNNNEMYFGSDFKTL